MGADPIDARPHHDRGRARAIGTPARSRAPGIGFVPEDRKAHGLVLATSVEHNIALPNHHRSRGRAWSARPRARGGAAHLIEQLGIKTPRPDRITRWLSGGNQQKVVLAKWLAGQAEILIFDEPTRGIDVGGQARHLRAHERAGRARRGVLHGVVRSAEVLGMSDRILVMRQGRIQAEFDATTASETAIMHAAFGVAS